MKASFALTTTHQSVINVVVVKDMNAVLPATTEQMIDPVPVEWRPIKCIPTDKCLESPSVCHVNATCTSSPTAEDGFVCTCNDDLQGDGITYLHTPNNQARKYLQHQQR
jgi:hypothetical protein